MVLRKSGHAKMASSTPGLIGGTYAIDFDQPVPGIAEHGEAFRARAGGVIGHVAHPVLRGWPARARALSALAVQQIRNLVLPLAHGPATLPGGDTGYFVICPAPPGPSLALSPRRWSESEIIERLLKPAAAVLVELQVRGVTHRAIRPNNVFQAAPGTGVTLGAAWAAPPASLQPHWAEPPYSAACLPCGRGDGMIADDVYALGALMLALALGRDPAQGLSPELLRFRKLDLGSYAALVADHRVPPTLGDLLRGMLADDPEHRPSPALLSNPGAARARRIAARPARRSQRPLGIGDVSASTARTIAYAIARNPDEGVAALRNGAIDRWLRRDIGDALAAGMIDDALRVRDMQAASGNAQADSRLRTCAIAVLDPLAPLVWRHLAIWPGGLGPALDQALHHAPDQTPILVEMAATHIAEDWARHRASDGDSRLDRLEMWEAGGLERPDRTSRPTLRLNYSLNPLVPCDSPLLRRYWPTRLPDLIAALEAASASIPPGQTLIDSHVAAFIVARRDERLQADLGHLATEVVPNDAMSELRLLARLQAKLHPHGLPHLSRWAAGAVAPILERLRSHMQRSLLADQIAAHVQRGHLPPIIVLLDDDRIALADDTGFAAAQARRAEIEHILAGLTEPAGDRVTAAHRNGQNVARAMGAFACLLALAMAFAVE